MLFTEFRGNTMIDSDGISLRAANEDSGEAQCAAFVGPWVRYAVIRANSVGGISEAAKFASHGTTLHPACAGIRAVSSGLASTDVVAEQNSFSCPPGGNASTSGYSLANCDHCVARL